MTDRPTHPALRSLALALLLALALSVLTTIGPGTAFACEHVDARPSSTSLDRIEDATRCLLNNRRAKRGLKKLDGNGKLEDAATRHSRDMADRNYFSHTSWNGDSLVERIRRTGYLSGSSSWLVGENIGWGSGSSGTPRSMVRAWMNSSGHKANILKSAFRDVGVGVARGAPRSGVSDAATYTTDFGKN